MMFLLGNGGLRETHNRDSTKSPQCFRFVILVNSSQMLFSISPHTCAPDPSELRSIPSLPGTSSIRRWGGWMASRSVVGTWPVNRDQSASSPRSSPDRTVRVLRSSPAPPLVCIAIVGVAFQVPEVNDMLMHRMESFSNLREDGSVNDRVASQQQAIAAFQSSPFGLGLGSDAYSKSDGPSYGVPPQTIGDNGIEEVLFSFGWCGSIIFS
jgi:hypothetical protein